MTSRSRIPLHRSIRTRIMLTFAIGSLLTTIVVGVVVDATVMTSGRAQLRARAADAVAAATATYDFTATVPIDVTVSDNSAPPAMRALARADTVVTWFDGHTMWAARRVDGGKLLTVRIAATDLLAERDQLREILAVLLIGVLAASTATGWLVAGSLTQRLRAAASRYAAPSSPDAIDVDEVGELVHRIDGLTEALAARLAAERMFSADVAHELRTPLTALSSATELLPDSDEAALVRRQTLRLRRLVEDLLELARAEHAFETHAEEHDLGVLARHILTEQHDIPVHTVAAPTRRIDAALLERVLLNLILNARRHGAEPIRVEVNATEIAVTDAGPGFPPALLEEGPRRFGKHGNGLGVGLGLAIATAWTERLGGHLILDNLDPGARAKIVFPQDPDDARWRGAVAARPRRLLHSQPLQGRSRK